MPVSKIEVVQAGESRKSFNDFMNDFNKVVKRKPIPILTCECGILTRHPSGVCAVCSVKARAEMLFVSVKEGIIDYSVLGYE